MAANSLKDIRKRISSVKSTQKITNAMKLVSASYFARAAQAVVRNRPYSQAFDRMINFLLSGNVDDIESPFLNDRPEKKTLIVLIGTDKGLCGGLNANNFKNALHWIQGKEKAGVAVDIWCWGRKAGLFGRKLKNKSLGTLEKTLEKASYEKAKDLAGELIKKFLDEEYDHICIAYPIFKSAMEQNPHIAQILPIDLKSQTGGEKIDQHATQAIIEPNLDMMIDRLLERKIYGDMFKVLLNGSAAEHGARMTAMDAATNNAKEVIKKLTVKYNRARQAAITKELIEIVSGAESLK